MAADDLTGWRAAWALGQAAAAGTKHDAEFVRNVLRRLVWSLNDESGSVGWRSAPGPGRIIAASPGSFPEFVPLVLSLLDLEERTFLPGTLWAIARMAECGVPGLDGAAALVRPYLAAPEPAVRGMAAVCAGALGDREAAAELEELLGDDALLCLFDGRDLMAVTVAASPGARSPRSSHGSLEGPVRHTLLDAPALTARTLRACRLGASTCLCCLCCLSSSTLPSQPFRIELNHLPPYPQPGQRQRRLHRGDDEQVEPGRGVVEQQRHQPVSLRRGDVLVAQQQENRILGEIAEGIDEGLCCQSFAAALQAPGDARPDTLKAGGKAANQMTGRIVRVTQRKAYRGVAALLHPPPQHPGRARPRRGDEEREPVTHALVQPRKRGRLSGIFGRKPRPLASWPHQRARMLAR